MVFVTVGCLHMIVILRIVARVTKERQVVFNLCKEIHE